MGWIKPAKRSATTSRRWSWEGYTDVIVAHQYGFTNAVAVLGTALGAEHIKILKRYTDRIVLVLGRRRSRAKNGPTKYWELFIAQQVDLRILTLPENLGPLRLFTTHREPRRSRRCSPNNRSTRWTTRFNR